MVDQRTASFNPETFTEGGGLLNDVVATWKECRFEMWDYNGKIPEANPALKVAFDVNGEVAEQYFSAGAAKDWAPSKDGKTLVAIGGARGINKTSNFGILLSSLIASKFPVDRLTDDCTVFEGMVTHLIRVPAPKRAGLAPKAPRADGKVFADENLVVDEIVTLPWDAKGGKKAAGKGAAKSGPVADDAMVTKAKDLILQTVMAAGGEMDKKSMSAELFKALTGDKDRTGIMQLVLAKDEELLGAIEGLEYADGKFTIA